MKWTRSYLRHSAPVAVVVILGISGATCSMLCVDSLLQSGQAGRVLTEEELAAIAGDGVCGKCVKTYACDTGFIESGNLCVRCNYDRTRDVCCDSSNSSDHCDYTGGTACPGDRYVGQVNGTPGSCNTCTPSSIQQDGACTGVRNARGSPCS